jgi:hypothetical protein
LRTRVTGASTRLAGAVATGRTIVPDRLYWLIFAVLVAGAVGMRAFWVYALEIPFVQPDSPSYLSPVIQNWLLPFSQSRTGGLSMFISAGLLIFRHPVGILIVNAILAIGSSVLLALAIKTVLRQNVLSLVALFATAFTAKNIALEFFLMSEHPARALYVVYAALILWTLQKPGRYGFAVLLGLAVTLDILEKPSAVVLIVATVMAFIAVAWFASGARPKVAATAAVFLIASIVPLLGYMAAFKARYGTFSMTQYEGVNQFSHVGHLIQLDGGKHPLLKERLKPLIEPYAANYAAKGNYQPNWLIYGSVTAELKRDFADRSPARTVREYVRERYPSEDLRWMNEVYGDIAMEAMFAHPIAYAVYAAERGYALWQQGYAFVYYQVLPSVPRIQRHREDRELQRKWLYEMSGETVPPCGTGAVVPARASGVPANLYRGPIASCDSLPYEQPLVAEVAGNVDVLYLRVTAPLAAIFPLLPKAGAIAAIAGGLLLVLLGGRRIRNIYAYGLLLALVLFGYTALHGLINVAETLRMTVNVQDYVIVGSFVFILCLLLGLQRLLLYAIVHSRRQQHARPLAAAEHHSAS